MTIKLFVEAIIKFLLGFFLVGVLIFLPAGTLCYANGKLLMVLLFVPMFFAGIIMMVKNPGLLKKRLDLNERHKEQRTVVKLCGLMFVLGFVVSGITYRFDRYILPKTVSLIFAVVFVLGYIIYAEVLRENIYLSRIIEVQENQKVIDTGLYAVVRHPMYSATLLLFLSIPFILGSVYALPFFMAYPFIVVKRIKNEEEVLKKELCGYAEYTRKVKYRLIPFIW